MAIFWSQKNVFTRHNGFRFPQFHATRHTAQGGLALPTLFNVEVESVVRQWLSLIVEDDSTTHEGLWMAVGRFMGVFYADDGIIGLTYPE